MKKKNIKNLIMIIILIFAIFGLQLRSYALTLSSGEVWSIYSTKVKKNEEINEQEIVDTVNKYIRDLNGSYINGQKPYTTYNGDHAITSPLVLQTTVTVMGQTNGGYQILIGSYNPQTEGNSGITESGGVTSYDQLKNRLGCPVSEEELGKIESQRTWNITIVATVPILSNPDTGLYNIDVKEVYEDKNWAANVIPEEQRSKIQIGVDPRIVDEETEQQEQEMENQGKVSDGFAPIIRGALFCLKKLGDFLQMLANFCQSGKNGVTIPPEELGGEIQYVEGEENRREKADVPNNYIRFSKGNPPTTKKEIVIPRGVETNTLIEYNTEQEINYGFIYNSENETDNAVDDNTEIPLISVDLFTLATNKVNYIDVNYLENKTNKFGSWKIIRDVVATIIHSVIVITSGCLITALIYTGIIIVKDSILVPTPEQKRIHNERVERIGKGFVFLVGTLFIQALCIYGSEAALGLLSDSKDTSLEGSLRIYVEETDYSFSTTPTGYYRYMAEINNDELLGLKASMTAWYLVFALANLILMLVMFGRMILMMIITIITFARIIIYVFARNGENELFKYKRWIISYVSLSLIQIVLALVVRLIVELGID